MSKNKDGPTLTVDALIEDEQGRILLIARGVEPFKGKWCLPGGKVEYGERVEAALEREMMEELGIRIGIRELVGIYSDPDRDPRGHYVTAAFHCTIVGGEPHTSAEVDAIHWLSRSEQDMEFGADHGKILQDWWNRRMDGKVLPSQELDLGAASPKLKDHPVDALVEQVADGLEEARSVEDEAGRGEREMKDADLRTTVARPMRGSGAKRTAPSGRVADKNS